MSTEVKKGVYFVGLLDADNNIVVPPEVVVAANKVQAITKLALRHKDVVGAGDVFGYGHKMELL